MSNSFPKIDSLQSFLEHYSYSEGVVPSVIRMYAQNCSTPPEGYTPPCGFSWGYGVEGAESISVLGNDELRDSGIESELYWLAREYSRFNSIRAGAESADYEAPKWLKKLPTEGRNRYWYHFLHMSVEADGDRGFVAYTPNHEYGKRDRQIRISVGRYLSKFYGEWLSEDDIRSIVNGCKPLKLVFGETEQDFVDAYLAVEDSCMGGMDFATSVERLGLHPAAVYAGTGDFKIACLVPEDATDMKNAVARAVIFRDDLFVRYYGTEASALFSQLIEAGYRFQASDYEGGRLRKIPLPNGQFLMPYVDGEAHCIVDDGKFWRLGYRGIQARNTSGCVEVVETIECDACGACYPEDEIEYSATEDEHYCEHCRDHDSRIVCAIVSLSSDRDWVRAGRVVYVEALSEYVLDDSELLEGLDLVLVDGEWVHVSETVLNVDGDRVVTHGDYFYAGESEFGEGYDTPCNIDETYRLAVCVREYELFVLRVVHPDLECDALDRSAELFGFGLTSDDRIVQMTIKEAAERFGSLLWTVVPSVVDVPIAPFNPNQPLLRDIRRTLHRIRDSLKTAVAASEPAAL